MKSLKFNALKSIFYILIFAGMLKLSGIIIAWVWNDLLLEKFHLNEISILEATGIVAFIYLVYAGIKFGFENIMNSNTQSVDTSEMAGNMPQCKECNHSRYILMHNTRVFTEELKDVIKHSQTSNYLKISDKLNNKIYHKFYIIPTLKRDN